MPVSYTHLDVYKRQALNAPEVREDRIAELKAKLDDPNYLNKAVAEMVADGILKQLGY